MAADFGLWAGSYTRGELPAMRAQAGAFLRRRQGATRFTGGRRRASHVQGITHWFAGEYLSKRGIISSVRSPFSSRARRRSDLSLRVGPGSPLWPYLAIRIVVVRRDRLRAIAGFERMRERTAGLTHANTLALGTMHATAF